MTEENDNEQTQMGLVARSSWFKDGEKDQNNLLEVLNDITEDYSQVNLNKAEAGQLTRQLRRMSTGSAQFAPMECAGADCPFARRCPLVQMKDSPDSHIRHGKAPVGQQCLLEVTMLRDGTLNLLREYEVDPNNFTEFNLVTEIAEIEILQWRLNMLLSRPENASLVLDQVVGVGQDGSPIVQQQVSPIFEQKQKLANRKTKLIKLMVGDRQEKYKKEAALKQKTEADASSTMAEVKKNLRVLQTEIEAKIEEANTIEGEVLTPEDLIDNAIEEGDS
jgi:hypothetical protein